MSENDNDFFVETYIKKQETLFLEQMRRLLQADTKSTVLEIALNERNATVAELEEQLRQLNTAISQAVNGLQSITNERDTLKKKLDEAEGKVDYLTEFQNKYRTVENELANKTLLAEKLNNELQSYQKNVDQLKENHQKNVDQLKENYSKNFDELKENYDKINGAYKTVENELANKSVITEKLSNKVETYQKSMDQMKENYDKLNGALEEANGKLSKLSNIKNNKKKLTPTNSNSEWTDGNQV
jgi:DNA repair exonuclease SbcCD ATPase subunit